MQMLFPYFGAALAAFESFRGNCRSVLNVTQHPERQLGSSQGLDLALCELEAKKRFASKLSKTPARCVYSTGTKPR